MCTVVVLATAEGLVLAGNRDELIVRPEALPPQIHDEAASPWLAPIDAKEGGTWTAVNAAGLAVSLLNNYQAPQDRAGPDPLSRGLVVAAIAACSDIASVLGALRSDALPLSRVRPFVLLIGHRSGELVRVAWDSEQLLATPVPLPHLEVSNGGDLARATAARTAVFAAHRRSWPAAGPSDLQLKALLASHDPERGHYSLCMHLDPIAATRSATIIRLGPSGATMRYVAGSPCTSDIEHRAALRWREVA